MSTQPKRESPGKPLGVIESLSAGFDAVSRAPQVMILPVLLDLFLWLGPRLSAYPLVKSLVAFMKNLPPAPDEAVRVQVTQAQALLEQAGQQFNLFAWLSPFLIGIPSLIANLSGNEQPWTQTSPVWEVDSLLVYLVLFGSFSLVGVGLNALYWSQIAFVVLNEQPGGRGRLVHAAHIWWGLFKLVLVLIIAGIVIGTPAIVAAMFTALLNPNLAQMLIIFAMAMLMWVAFYLLFVVHGVALRESAFIEAVRISVGLLRTQFLPTGGLLILGAIIYFGLGLVWAQPPGDSWLRAGAIFGNAFIASGVLCATAFFYLARAPVEMMNDENLKSAV